MNDETSDDKPLSGRAKAQRERILAAAQHCFVKFGFHAASMSNIADEAGMSAGLIYRYFPNKSAIVLAIIERQTDIELEDMREFSAATDPVEAIVECFATWSRPKPDMRMMNAALFLETCAESTRDDAVAQATRTADRIGMDAFQELLTKPASEGGFGMSPELAQRRALAFLCLIEGLAVRAARDPDLDLGQLRDALRDVVPRLFQP